MKIATKDTTKLEELELIKKSLMEHYNPLFEQILLIPSLF